MYPGIEVSIEVSYEVLEEVFKETDRSPNVAATRLVSIRHCAASSFNSGVLEVVHIGQTEAIMLVEQPLFTADSVIACP